MARDKAITAFGLVLLCLLASSSACLQPVKAQSKGDININSDGSITQPTMLVQKIAGVYVLTVDTNLSIAMQKSDIIFDGNNHTLSGNTLYVLDASNVTVRNLTVANSYQGI